MSVSIGDMKKRVTIQQRTTIQDGSFGSQLSTWTDIATVWCAIAGLSMKEHMSAAAFSSEVTFKLTLRHQSFLDDPRLVASFRGLYNGRIFCFHGAINEFERGRFTIIYASEGLNDG
ncbi:MAG: phage head closure protein [Azonexus sp.]